MRLASSADNIRYNGTGRVYVAPVGGSQYDDLGELESLSYTQSVSTAKLRSTRNAARATILEVETEREASLTIGLREMTEENLKMALLGGDFQTQNQAAGYVDLGSPQTAVKDKYIDLGHLNVYVRRLTHGTPSGGQFAIGDTVTGQNSGASGKVAWKGSGYLELVNLSGGDDWIVGETITNGTVTATLTGSEKLEDVIVVDDDTPTVRYTQGVDYTLDPDYGMLRILSAGSVGTQFSVAYNYEAVDKRYMWALSAGSIERKVVVVTDKDDRGTRLRYTFHRVLFNLSGDFPLIGEGVAVLNVTGTVLADTSQPSGQEYYRVEAM